MIKSDIQIDLDVKATESAKTNMNVTAEHEIESLTKLLDIASNKISDRIHAISDLSEDKTGTLSNQFQTLSANATLQSQYLNQLISIAQTVQVGDHSINIHEISMLLHKTFLESISCILEISKQAMLMVYILNDADKNLKEIEKSIRQIEIINHKTKYLSINATIEAVRAGEAGESFQVVASEVRDLSNDTQRLAINIRSQVNQMSSTLNYAEDILQKVASIDMSTNILAKEQLDDMMKGLIDNSQQISNIVNDATRASEQFSKTARELITDIQYQDRIRQDLNYIQETVDSLEHVNQYVQQKSGDLDKELTPEEIAKNLPYSFSKEIETITADKDPISSGHIQEPKAKENNVELF